MDVDGVIPGIEELLAHAGWVRALARELVRDDASADDAVQATWLAALERPPRRGDNPRGWLARVLGNAARSEGGALAREVTADRPLSAAPRQKDGALSRAP